VKLFALHTGIKNIPRNIKENIPQGIFLGKRKWDHGKNIYENS
jgi:hypothetical protein